MSISSSSKIISSKPILTKKLFSIEEKEVDVNGKKTTHHQIEFNSVATIFPLTEQYELYLIHQYRYMLGGIVLGAPAGHIDVGEAPLAAAQRELKEETGMSASQWEQLTEIDLARSGLHAKQYLFLAKGLSFGQAYPEEDEEIEVVKIALEEAVQAVLSGKITHAASIIGILMIHEMIRNKSFSF